LAVLAKQFFCQIIVGSPLNNNVPEGRSVIPWYLDTRIPGYLASLDNLISWRTDTKLRVIKVVQNTARQWLEKLAFSLNTFLVGLPDTYRSMPPGLLAK
jgi:hypothetical protein